MEMKLTEEKKEDLFEARFFRCIKLGEIKMRLVSQIHDKENTQAFIYGQQLLIGPSGRPNSSPIESVLNVDGTTIFKYLSAEDFKFPKEGEGMDRR